MGGLFIFILSIIIIIIGFLMVIAGILLAGIKAVLKIIEGIFYLIFRLFHKMTVERSLNNAELTDDEIQSITASERSRNKRREYKRNSIEDVHNGIILYCLKMKNKYPNVSEGLILQIERELLRSSNSLALRDYEEVIKKNHEKNNFFGRDTYLDDIRRF